MTDNREPIAIDNREYKLKSSVFFIEATTFEQLCLWKENKDKVNWEQDVQGFTHIIGYIDPGAQKMPVNVCFTFEKIYGQRICFFNVVSRYADHTMVEDWLKKHYPVKYDNGQRDAITDALNFVHALHHCKKLSETHIGFSD